MYVKVRDAADRRRYEALDGQQVAGTLQYEPVSPTVVEFVHTKVDTASEGKGVGSALVRGALDDLARRGMGVVPTCPFVAGWIDRHPDYARLVRRP